MSQSLRPLIEAARAGDRDARNAIAGCVDRFVRLFSGSLSRQARRACGSTIDFVNEGLAEALAKLGEFEYRSDEEFYGWVGRLIRSRILDAVRRQNAGKRAGNPLPLEEGIDAAAPGSGSPSRLAVEEEVRDAVRRAVLDLQVEHAGEMEAVVLKVFDGLSWQQVQDCMALSSQKRARTLCARGLDLLRPRVESVLGDSAFEEYLGL